jgi:hypothetical protein
MEWTENVPVPFPGIELQCQAYLDPVGYIKVVWLTEQPNALYIFNTGFGDLRQNHFQSGYGSNKTSEYQRTFPGD